MEQHQQLLQVFTKDELLLERARLKNIYPFDAKYAHKIDSLRDFLSPFAEWLMCAKIQLIYLAVRSNVPVKEELLIRFDALLADLIEGKITHHDMLAVIEALGIHLTLEEKALLHPGTTSYDVLDTARNYLFKHAWFAVIRPAVIELLQQLVWLAEGTKGIIAAGRTHLQLTSPVSYGRRFSRQAHLTAEQVVAIDAAANDMRGTATGIVGTGAGIDMVLGENEQELFENTVLKVHLGLKPDYTASQIVQKQRLARFAHEMAMLGMTNAKFANDIRLLYSSGIGELTSRKNKDRLGGSSTDAGKNNPINYENMAATASSLKAGMIIIHDMLMTDLERDLRDSKLARMQPQMMFVETYESLTRMIKSLKDLSLNEDIIALNLQKVRDKPSEAMTTILRGGQFIHSKIGIGHDFAKWASKKAQTENKRLIDAALEDAEFKEFYKQLPEKKQMILQGALEYYMGSEYKLIEKNIEVAKSVIDIDTTQFDTAHILPQ